MPTSTRALALCTLHTCMVRACRVYGSCSQPRVLLWGHCINRVVAQPLAQALLICFDTTEEHVWRSWCVLTYQDQTHTRIHHSVHPPAPANQRSKVCVLLCLAEGGGWNRLRVMAER